MATNKREWIESPVGQGTDEQVRYVFTVPSSWGSAPFTSLSATLHQDPHGQNLSMTSTCLSGSTEASGAEITSPFVLNLTAEEEYRLKVKFTTSEGNILSHHGIIKGEI